MTRTRQKAQEIESQNEESSSEPMEENRRLTRTSRKNQEDEADVAPPQRATRTLQSAKVNTEIKCKYFIIFFTFMYGYDYIFK